MAVDMGPIRRPDPIRPSMRGVIHRYATLAYLPLFASLVYLARGTGDRVACLVYGLGVLTMLAVSATYHSGRLSPRATARMRRVDHTTILLAIAGSYTAVAAVGLTGSSARTLLVAIWVAAPIGMLLRAVWFDAPYPVIAVIYVGTGWIALIELPAMADALTSTQLGLVVAGGLLYTVGAIVYALHRPNPWPATFGYHEIFHSFVTAGVTTHFVAVLSLVLDTR